MKLFFQSIGTLVGYNFALPHFMSLHQNIEKIMIEATPWAYLMGGFLYLKHDRKLNFIPRISVEQLNKLGKTLLCRLATLCDVLHLNWNLCSYFDSLLDTVINRPKVYTCHSSAVGVDRNDSKGLKDIAACVDAFVAPSYFVANNVREIIGYDPLVIHHGVDHSLHNMMIDRHKAKRSLGILNEHGRIVLWNSRISPEKDLETFLRALPTMIRSAPDVLFIIKGRTIRERKRVIKKLKETQKNFKENVIVDLSWIPYQKMVYYYRCADVFVHTSLDEAFGLTLVEAMACGTPVVAADTATAPEIVGDAGMLFSPRNPEELAEKVITLLSNDKLRERLAQAAVHRIKECSFTWENVADKYTSLYLSLV